MRVVERFVQGKYGDPTRCEDLVVETPGYVAVFDGATPKNNFRWKGKGTGRWAAELAAGVLGRLPADSPLGEFLLRVEREFQSFYTARGRADLVQREPAERLQSAGVILSRQRREVWVIGDCQVLVAGELVAPAHKGVDAIMASARSLILESEIIRGKAMAELRDRDPGREGISEMLKRSADFANRADSPFGYSVLDGFPVPMELVRLVRLPKEETEVVLASDGYPRLRPTLKASEAELADLVEKDPLCFRQFPSTKGVQTGQGSMDDRAYVRVVVGAL